LDFGVLQHLIHGFPLSGPESGHTERHARTRDYRAKGVATVLFHPDFNRRLRNHTESADPFPFGSSERKRRSRAWAKAALTAGGDFHPALRTSAARNGRPAPKYDQPPTSGQAPLTRRIGMSPCRPDRASSQGRRGRDRVGASWFETALAPLLTMRVNDFAANTALVLRSPQQAGVSKDGLRRNCLSKLSSTCDSLGGSA